MNALGYRLPVICLVGAGLAACSAAGNAAQHTPDGDQPGLELSPSDDDEGTGASNGAGARGNGKATDPNEPGMGGGGAGGGNHPGKDNCDCGTLIPGIDIKHDGDGISVVVDLPTGGAILIDTKTGSCKTSNGGIDIKGDVTVDLGSGTDVPLFDADLHIAVGATSPSISGTANVAGSLLDGVTGGAGGIVAVDVSLDPNVEQGMPSSTAEALLDLSLKLPGGSVGCGCMPAMKNDLAFVDAKVVVAVDGCHKVLKISGDVTAQADALWTSMVPLQAMGKLDATAMIVDGALTQVEVDGDLRVKGGALWCGLAPLQASSMTRAKLTMNEQGAKLTATTKAALLTSISVTGDADVLASFDEHAWSIVVCANVDAELTLASAKVSTCVDLSATGSKTCDRPAELN